MAPNSSLSLRCQIIHEIVVGDEIIKYASFLRMITLFSSDLHAVPLTKLPTMVVIIQLWTSQSLTRITHDNNYAALCKVVYRGLAVGVLKISARTDATMVINACNHRQ